MSDDKETQGSGFALSTRIVLATVSMIFNLFFVGMGQFYNRNWLSGVAYSFGAFVLWFLLLGWVPQIVSMLHAGYTTFRETGESDASEDPRWTVVRTMTFFVPISVAAAVFVYFNDLDLLWLL